MDRSKNDRVVLGSGDGGGISLKSAAVAKTKRSPVLLPWRQTFALPRQSSLDFQLERQTQKGADEDN